jgi:hypothetical protein
MNKEHHPSFDKHALKNLEAKKQKLKIATKKYINSINDNKPYRVKFLKAYLRSRKKYLAAVEQSFLTMENLKLLQDKIIDIKLHLSFPGLDPTLPNHEYSPANLSILENTYSSRLLERDLRIAEYERLYLKKHRVNNLSKGNPQQVKALQLKQEKFFSKWLNDLESGDDATMAKDAVRVSKLEAKLENIALSVKQ